MGLLVNGAWQEDISRTKEGRFIRPSSSFRNFVTADGSAGPTGEGGFPAEAGRYHLYISLACPWAHRTLIFRALKKLENVDLVHQHRAALRQDRLGIRHRARRHDRRRQRQERRSPKSICSPIRIIPAASRCRCCGTRSGAPSSTTNPPRSSACSIRRSTPSPTPTPIIIPPHCAAKSTASTTSSIRTSTMASIAPASPPSQDAYEEAARGIFTAFDQLEERLSRQRYLAGAQITEADWRLFTTLIRFDSVYYSHFKCNLRRVADYPNLWNYTARPLSGAGRGRDRQHRSDQAALLRQPAPGQSDRHRADRAASSISPRRMTAGVSARTITRFPTARGR